MQKFSINRFTGTDLQQELAFQRLRARKKIFFHDEYFFTQFLKRALAFMDIHCIAQQALKYASTKQHRHGSRRLPRAAYLDLVQFLHVDEQHGVDVLHAQHGSRQHQSDELLGRAAHLAAGNTSISLALWPHSDCCC